MYRIIPSALRYIVLYKYDIARGLERRRVTEEARDPEFRTGWRTHALRASNGLLRNDARESGFRVEVKYTRYIIIYIRLYLIKHISIVRDYMYKCMVYMYVHCGRDFN